MDFETTPTQITDTARQRTQQGGASNSSRFTTSLDSASRGVANQSVQTRIVDYMPRNSQQRKQAGPGTAQGAQQETRTPPAVTTENRDMRARVPSAIVENKSLRRRVQKLEEQNAVLRRQITSPAGSVRLPQPDSYDELRRIAQVQREQIVSILRQKAEADRLLMEHECMRELQAIGISGAGEQALQSLRGSEALISEHERDHVMAQLVISEKTAVEHNEMDYGELLGTVLTDTMTETSPIVVTMREQLYMAQQRSLEQQRKVLDRQLVDYQLRRRLLLRRIRLLYNWNQTALARMCREYQLSDPTMPQIPLENPRYQVLRPLGAGGCGEVHLAYDLQRYAYVAVKLHTMHSNWRSDQYAAFMRHVYREVRLQSQLRHPNVIAVSDAFVLDEARGNIFACVQEYADGGDLDEVLVRKGRLDPLYAAAIFRQIMLGLHYLHTPRNYELPDESEQFAVQGDLESTMSGVAKTHTRLISVVHFDLKPANILFDSSGCARITDFGLSKLARPNDSGIDNVTLTSPGTGTPGYLPPEISTFSTGPGSDSLPLVTPAVDIWSAGVILYRMIYGQRPFPGLPPRNDLEFDVQLTFPPLKLVGQAVQLVSQAQELIRMMLCPDPYRRPTAIEVLHHPFLAVQNAK